MLNIEYFKKNSNSEKKCFFPPKFCGHGKNIIITFKLSTFDEKTLVNIAFVLLWRHENLLQKDHKK